MRNVPLFKQRQKSNIESIFIFSHHIPTRFLFLFFIFYYSLTHRRTYSVLFLFLNICFFFGDVVIQCVFKSSFNDERKIRRLRSFSLSLSYCQEGLRSSAFYSPLKDLSLSPSVCVSASMVYRRREFLINSALLVGNVKCFHWSRHKYRSCRSAIH